jgi:hypothetical protein
MSKLLVQIGSVGDDPILGHWRIWRKELLCSFGGDERLRWDGLECKQGPLFIGGEKWQGRYLSIKAFILRRN